VLVDRIELTLNARGKLDIDLYERSRRYPEQRRAVRSNDPSVQQIKAVGDYVYQLIVQLMQNLDTGRNGYEGTSQELLGLMHRELRNGWLLAAREDVPKNVRAMSPACRGRPRSEETPARALRSEGGLSDAVHAMDEDPRWLQRRRAIE
jgi:hypothetical protein